MSVSFSNFRFLKRGLACSWKWANERSLIAFVLQSDSLTYGFLILTPKHSIFFSIEFSRAKRKCIAIAMPFVTLRDTLYLSLILLKYLAQEKGF